MAAKPELPRGTVTFLFTDVEGSTQLLQRYPRAYPEAIARHHAILREAVEAADGAVFETVGDAVYAAFARVEDAARAAVAAQRGLAQEPWGETGPIRVRMAIHTGDVERQDGHYFGPALYRCARLMASAHGGQVVASAAAAEILADRAPVGIGLRDLGEYRLKDLQRPERVYQLTAEDLRSDFPPLRTLDARPHNLPVLRTALVGRERELAAARNLLLANDTRLLTLIGPGGVGKTRLALELAADASDAFASGVFFVPLARVADPALVANAIAGSLSLRDAPGRPLADTLRDFLREKELLLVLDNFEHLLEAAPAAADLLDNAPRLRILATSQAALRVYGEREYAVPPLGVAADGEMSPAVSLFIQRARDIRPDFEPAAALHAIGEICRRLDGLPLAIELAAARVRTLAPSEILTRLDRQLTLLTGGARDLPARQRTLRDAITWSYDLLDPAEATAFRRFAAFNGGCALEDAEAVLTFGEIAGGDVLALLDSLTAKSLLRADGGRFSMLAVIQEFAAERLRQSGEAADARRRHAERFLAFATAADGLLRGPEQLGALIRLDAEVDNMRAALTWAASSDGDAVVALRLAAALGGHWFFRSRTSEARHWLAQVLPPPALAPDRESASALSWAGWFASEIGAMDEARVLAEEALAAARRAGDSAMMVFVLIGAVYLTSDPARRVSLQDEAIEIADRSGDPWSIAYAHVIAGEIARLSGEEDRALAFYARSREASLRVGDRFLRLLGLVNPAHIHLRRGDIGLARAELEESLRLSRELGHDWTTGYCLIGLGGVAVASGEAERGTSLLSAADAWFRGMGIIIEPVDRAEYDRYEAAARRSLDEAAFAASWRKGQTLSLEQAVALATGRGEKQ